MPQITDRLIFSFAQALIDRHGIEAAAIAAARAAQRLGLGDPDGAAVWRRIKRAIEDLQILR